MGLGFEHSLTATQHAVRISGGHSCDARPDRRRTKINAIGPKCATVLSCIHTISNVLLAHETDWVSRTDEMLGTRLSEAPEYSRGPSALNKIVHGYQDIFCAGSGSVLFEHKSRPPERGVSALWPSKCSLKSRNDDAARRIEGYGGVNRKHSSSPAAF